MYKGKPVFRAMNSKKLAQAVAEYNSKEGGPQGKAEAPYVVEIAASRSKKISKGAFMDDPTVGVVILGEAVREIGTFAFAGCSNLSEFVFCDSVKKISNGVFEDCISLTEIHVPDSVEEMSIVNSN